MPKKATQQSFAGFDADQVSPVLKESNSVETSSSEVVEPSVAPTEFDFSGPLDLTDRLVVVVDSHSLIYQVFHAMPSMNSPTGIPVAAVHGFIADVLELLVRKKPDFLFCAFDKSEATFRNELYAEYKANRESMPEELRQQIPLIRNMLEAMGIPQLECSGFEADDILAKLSVDVDRAGGSCLIVTSDKDCRQLITERIKLYNIRRDTVMGVEELWSDWGVRPEQVVDYQAMVGDPVDNVPGIPLVGPKLAQQLLAQFSTLEGVLENAASVSGPKRRQNIEQGRERVMLSRTLVRLRADTPCEIPWSQGMVGQADMEKVTSMCELFGFRRLKDRAKDVLGRGSSAPVRATREVPTHYRCIKTQAELNDLADHLAKFELLCIDTETTSTSARGSEWVGMSVGWAPGEAAYIPVRAPMGEPQFGAQVVADAMRQVLENPAIAKLGQNIKFDLIVLRNAGIRVQGLAHDTMVADYLVEPGQRNHTLDELAIRYLNHKTIPISDLIGTGKNQRQMDQVPLAQVATYAAEDADIPLRILPELQERLEKLNLEGLYQRVEVPLIEVLAEMEYNGIRVDVARLQELSRGFTTEIARLRTEIFDLAGGEFNIDSPKQLGTILFTQLALPVIKKTKTGASTDADVLQELAHIHPLPAKVVAYRQAMKLKNTYVDALPELVCERTGRVHTSFRQDVAATGRLSSSDPNLQNIPIRNEQGRAIRSAFTAGEPGWLLLGADYSQIELRVLAHYSSDPALMDAYETDADIHCRVAAEVHGVAECDVTSEMRRMAKTINFGIVYGQSAFGLARTLGIPKDQAAEYIELYFSRYPGVQAFMLQTLDQCRRMGYVETMLGRRRTIQGVRDFNTIGVSKMRSLTEAERIAVNTVIQGSAADLIKLAMLTAHRTLKSSGIAARMLLQIHDELLFEVAPEAVDSLDQLVRDAMIGVAQLRVPLKVDVAVGATWAEV